MWLKVFSLLLHSWTPTASEDMLLAPSYPWPHIYMIDVIVKQVFNSIIDEVNASPYYSILADKVTSCNIEHPSVCVRFLDQQKNCREEFLAF